MSYQHEYMKSARARRAYPWHRPTGCMDNNYSACHFLVNPACTFTCSFAAAFAVLNLKEKASCYRDLSETYLGTGHDFGE